MKMPRELSAVGKILTVNNTFTEPYFKMSRLFL